MADKFLNKEGLNYLISKIKSADAGLKSSTDASLKALNNTVINNKAEQDALNIAVNNYRKRVTRNTPSPKNLLIGNGHSWMGVTTIGCHDAWAYGGGLVSNFNYVGGVSGDFMARPDEGVEFYRSPSGTGDFQQYVLICPIAEPLDRFATYTVRIGIKGRVDSDGNDLSRSYNRSKWEESSELDGGSAYSGLKFFLAYVGTINEDEPMKFIDIPGLTEDSFIGDDHIAAQLTTEAQSKLNMKSLVRRPSDYYKYGTDADDPYADYYECTLSLLYPVGLDASEKVFPLTNDEGYRLCLCITEVDMDMSSNPDFNNWLYCADSISNVQFFKGYGKKEDYEILDTDECVSNMIIPVDNDYNPFESVSINQRIDDISYSLNAIIGNQPGTGSSYINTLPKDGFLGGFRYGGYSAESSLTANFGKIYYWKPAEGTAVTLKTPSSQYISGGRSNNIKYFTQNPGAVSSYLSRVQVGVSYIYIDTGLLQGTGVSFNLPSGAINLGDITPADIMSLLSVSEYLIKLYKVYNGSGFVVLYEILALK